MVLSEPKFQRYIEFYHGGASISLAFDVLYQSSLEGFADEHGLRSTGLPCTVEIEITF
jgi:hypothetical protein